MNNIKIAKQKNAILPAEIMLIYGRLDLGGIETLIVRIANFLAFSGMRVTVCLSTGGELKASLHGDVNIIEYGETNDLLGAVDQYRYHSSCIDEMLVISFDPISAARALMVEIVLSNSLTVVHITGVFHPHAYFMLGERKDRVLLNYLVAQAVGKEQIFFMNEECRDAHGAKWATDLSSSQLLALPVNQVDATWHPPRNSTLRIVSVGRLVGFKTYNMGAAKIVKACLDQGVSLTWDIYGYGIQHDAIQAEIDLLGVADFVSLLGKLDYSEFERTLVSYDLFVGMGTSALEAAMMGLPTVCATINEATRCYGYIHELPFGNVGELQSISPNEEIAELICRYSALSQDERVYMSAQCRATAENYGLPKFVDALARLTANKHKKPSIIKKFLIAWLYRFVTESYLAKIFRHIISKNAC